MVLLVPGSLTRLYRVQHVTASISSRGKHAITTQCFVKDVPPASGGIIHAVCRFLQSCSNVKRMTCFWWQLAHNIAVHILRLSLKKSCSEINVKKIPSLTGGHLTTHSKSGSCGSRESVCKYSFCLSWKPLNTHLAFALRKLPCLSVLMVSTHHPVT